MIYLVRHGQTAFNVERRLQGHVDSQLTDLGLAQAAAVAELLARLADAAAGGPWRLISSPLGRAQRTAEIIGRRLALPIETEPRLIELSWGNWDGRLRRELEAEQPDAFGHSGWAFRAPTGESYESVNARMAAWLADLPAEPERRVIAVTHGVAGRVLRGAYAGMGRDATISQEVPQDAVFRLAAGRIERIDCAPVAAG